MAINESLQSYAGQSPSTCQYNGKDIGICSHVWECWVLTGSQWSLCLKTPWACMHVTPNLQISIHSQKIKEKAKKKTKCCLQSFP